MYTVGSFLEEAFIKKYSIPVGLIGLALTAMSTFGFKMEGTIPVITYWASVWLLIAVVILFLIALSLSVKKLNVYVNTRFNIGELPPVFSVHSMDDGLHAKMILHSKENINLQKDAVVSVVFNDENEGATELALGVVTDQTDGKIALVATPKSSMKEKWSAILESSHEYIGKLTVRTIIDRNYVNDDYLFKENYDIGILQQASDDVNDDGEGITL